MSSLPGALRALHQRPRWDRDWYVEPAWAVEALFDMVRFVGAIHDPCCGGGTIPKVARGRGFMATGSDIINRGFGEGEIDFLTDRRRRFNVVMNPPYNRAERFVQYALQIVEFKVAVIVPLNFTAGQARSQSLFLPHPPARQIVLSKRPSMPPGGTDIPAKGGTTDYCWLVWDHDHDGPTIAEWWNPETGWPDAARRRLRRP
jgi:hypothetical protein